ncbi:hypothetical protein [Marinobacter sp. C7]|uniref:tetratricopeptide repeat protein n=1 Tax=Marinobacter sp. C7 TaxID=2951363 RepID=UPI001EF1244D|nr:hypothetical protein [Marinobacter sp. C7]
MIHKASTAMLLMLGIAGCSSLPDMERAEREAEAGNLGAARAELTKLAEFGLADAQVELGDLYSDEDSDEAFRKALHWYQAAAEQGSDRALSRLGKLYARDGKSVTQRGKGEFYLKKAMAAGDDSALMPLIELYLDHPREFPEADPVQWIQRARQKGDPSGDLALARYYIMNGQLQARAGEIVSLCEPIAISHPDCLIILARVYLEERQNDRFDALVTRAREAWEQGKIDDRDLYVFARWLSDDESPAKQVAVTNDLYQLLIPDYVPAITGRARLIMDNTYLADAEEVIRLLETSRSQGDLKASLTLARVYERGRIVPIDARKAIEYALEAREKYPSADYLLGRIYKRGYLGEPEPRKARDYLLKAARRGYAKADYVLAEMFWEGKGIEVNKLYAWSFALLANEAGLPRARELLVEMVPQMPRALEQAAETLANRELAARREASGEAGETNRQNQGS